MKTGPNFGATIFLSTFKEIVLAPQFGAFFQHYFATLQQKKYQTNSSLSCLFPREKEEKRKLEQQRQEEALRKLEQQQLKEKSTNKTWNSSVFSTPQPTLADIQKLEKEQKQVSALTLVFHFLLHHLVT